MGKRKITFIVKEVSEMIDILNPKIYEMARLNQIPHIKVGSQIIFHEDVLRDWMGAAIVTPRGPLFAPLHSEQNQETILLELNSRCISLEERFGLYKQY
ncbi:helix-turn-helix domain-containing protein [Brevibacillus laterosporus]|uniref:helix-turn-helix domain-containing protein n=1 Tax=Brevibacillus laterosporus TaxID=1465 RepID=UPI000316CFF5|nr:helix-turn-helix domain-containing protein [Brevibacillus laterosporus]